MTRPRIINIHEAKTHLSQLLGEVAEGREVVIAKSGTPIAKLVPIEAIPPPRKAGCLKGKMTIGKDFDAPLPDDLQQAFEGRT